MKKVLYVFLFLISFNANAQKAIMSVDENVIAPMQSFVLTISLDKQTGEEPDFSPLEKDFQIISINNSFNTQFVNGIMSQSIEYILTLMPKTQGNITIPVISIGDLKTNSVNISVDANKKPAQAKAPTIKLIDKIEKQTAYVQEEINYSISIIDDGSLEISAPIFQNNKDFVIKSIANPQINAITEDGKKLREIKFEYALFAQKSGVLSIPIFEIQGHILEKTKSNDPFAGSIFSNMGFSFDVIKKPFALRAEPKEITINPSPKDWGDKWWLPAHNVVLEDDFITTEYKINEPIKRKITLIAKGVIDTQLPELVFAPQSGFKQYPQKSASTSLVEDKEVLAIKEFNHTYIPTQNGELTIPEITINWFDVKANMAKTTKLNAINVVITGEAASMPEPLISKEIIEQATKAADSKRAKKTNYISFFIIVIALLLGMILGFAISKKQAKTDYKKMVLNSKNNKEFEKNTIQWAQNKYGNVFNIKDVENKVKDKHFSMAINNLSQSIYSNNVKFNKTLFVEEFKRISNKKTHKKEDDILPNLYK